MKKAKDLGIKTVAMTGEKGGKMKEKADFAIGSNMEDSVVKKILEIYNIKNTNSGII